MKITTTIVLTIVIAMFASWVCVTFRADSPRVLNIVMLFEENVEALSQVESGEYVRCWETVMSDPTDDVRYCGTCSVIPGRGYSGMGFCK